MDTQTFETSGQSLALHVCVVERVHDDGLVDLVSEKGHNFDNINVMRAGVERIPQEGEWVIVLTDGTQYIVLGHVERGDRPERQDYKPPQDDLADLSDTQTLLSSDEAGNQARVMVSKGGGVLIDAGRFSAAHYDIGQNKLHHFLERHEAVYPTGYMRREHNGQTASYRWAMYTQPSEPATRKALDYEERPTTESGGALHFDYNDDGLKVTLRRDNEEKVVFHSDLSGTLSLSQPHMEVSSQSKGPFEVETDESLSWDAKKQVTFDTKQTFRVKADQKIVLYAKDVNIGQQAQQQTAALAPPVASNMASFIQSYNSHTHPVLLPLIPLPGGPAPTGPTTTPHNPSDQASIRKMIETDHVTLS